MHPSVERVLVAASCPERDKPETGKGWRASLMPIVQLLAHTGLQSSLAVMGALNVTKEHE